MPEDFEKWHLHDDDGEKVDRCFLGQKISYSRRKSDAVCVVGKEFVELDSETVTCECAKSDYEWFDLR